MKLIKELGLRETTTMVTYKGITKPEKRMFALFKCDYCGQEVEKIKRDGLKYKSCGCAKYTDNKSSRTHGMRKHKIYTAWAGMKDRCYREKNKHYKNYGAKGVTVCDRWLHSFENFRDDMLPTWKEGLSIDRIDPYGNYEPSNCRWANTTTQARNIRKIRKNNTSGYKGVSKYKNTFVVNISINGINIRIGTFKSAKSAAKAYDNFIIENKLEHTRNGII